MCPEVSQHKEMIKTKFQEELDKFVTSEEKLHFTIETMRLSLSQEKRPDFKQFWETKHACITLFKEKLNPIVREKLWREYSELIREENKVQKILEEESSFLLEQIKLVFEVLENELTFYDQQLAKINDIQFSKNCFGIYKKTAIYNDMQRELTLLNSFAARINSLKKEIEKASIRYKHKNELFTRLSSLGDKVFPKRKELIKKISLEFEGDVKEFSDKILKVTGPIKIPYYALKEEIKELQYLAKIFTINTQTFNFVREMLSECWEKIKIEEKEVKKKKQEEITVEKQEKIKALPKLEPFSWDKIKREISLMEQESVEELIKQIEHLKIRMMNMAVDEEIKMNIVDLCLDVLEQKEEEKLTKELAFEKKIHRRDVIKKRMEQYKKIAASSGLNFEKAIIYQDMLDKEKNSLMKIDLFLEEMENAEK